MFTKLGSVVLWFAIIIGAIASIVLGVVVGKMAGGGVGFLVVVLGWLVTLISNLALGIIVEISNNTKEAADNTRNSRELLEKISASGGKPVANGNASAFTVNNSKGGLTEKSAAENEDWVCSKCGEKNGSAYPFCTICGQPRLDKK